MDIEVVEAIESLRDEIRRVETSLRAEIGNEVGTLRAEMRTEMASKNDLKSLREELIRHTDIQIESVRDDIRILAEGFAWLGAKIDRITPPHS